MTRKQYHPRDEIPLRRIVMSDKYQRFFTIARDLPFDDADRIIKAHKRAFLNDVADEIDLWNGDAVTIKLDIDLRPTLPGEYGHTVEGTAYMLQARLWRRDRYGDA